MEINLRQAMIGHIGKNIGKLPLKGLLDPWNRIDIDPFFKQIIKRTDIIQAGNVIFMFMGIQNSIQIFHTFPEHLVPEIRTTVDH
ncbi:hypothetical protein D9M68_854140 [compost metagenome]